MNLDRPLRIGTRGSRLAIIQAEAVRDAIAAARPDLPPPEIVEVRTTGDRVQDRPLAEIGGKGLFTKEIERGLLDGEVDMAMHSMKDVPTWLPDGLVIAAVLASEDPRDALVADRPLRLADLPQGARIGTASLRRQGQLLHARPDLAVSLLRGNVPTRMGRVRDGSFDATVLALSGLRRLGAEEGCVPLAPEEMLPSACQGVIGVEVREADDSLRDLLAGIDHGPTMRRVMAERAALAAVDGSCRTPVGVLAEEGVDGAMRLRVLVTRPDGSEVWRAERRGPAADGAAMGTDAGGEVRGRADPALFQD